jgi:hypothetical protein
VFPSSQASAVFSSPSPQTIEQWVWLLEGEYPVLQVTQKE